MVLPLTLSLITIGVLCGFVALFLYHWKRLRLYRAAAKFPGPPAYPIIGNSLIFIGSTADIFKKIIELLDAYPSPFRAWLGGRLFFAVHDPDQAKAIFLSPKTLEKEDLYKFARPWLGTGIFTAPVTKWRIHRKLIMPTFNQKILESFVDIFANQSMIMVREMEVEVDGKEFGIFKYVSLCTLDIICETAMGISMKAQTDNDCVYVDSATRMFELILTRMFKIWLHPDIIFKFTRLAKEQRQCIKYLHNVTNNVIQKKKAALSGTEDSQDNNKENTQDGLRRKIFLDMLMELSHEGTKFTDEELREEVDTMMIAGNDTTATVNCFAMLMLASFPEVQEKVYQELLDIYGPDDIETALVRNEDLQRMEYLERVIKETLRLFPVGPILVRRVTQDFDIGGHILPEGSSVVLGVIKLHRNEDYWPDPFKFDPDRFLPEEVAKRHPYCWVPFSAGPRNCLGLKYAMMAMKALLSTVLRNYKLIKDNPVPVKDIQLKLDVVLKAAKPVTMRIERRNRKHHTNSNREL
ncbi:cytochrome P450 4C1 [Orussus abietinus]|uniref:cytochrome P450 4C1 n=1 Tax=Orussus abietinus TaxID=222816 RepID=UPI0006257B51|nr:cytochrome P450 4C1 [Orussus abietinus]